MNSNVCSLMYFRGKPDKHLLSRNTGFLPVSGLERARKHQNTAYNSTGWVVHLTCNGPHGTRNEMPSRAGGGAGTGISARQLSWEGRRAGGQAVRRQDLNETKTWGVRSGASKQEVPHRRPRSVQKGHRFVVTVPRPSPGQPS